ncbi:TlpA family protein disulfide reductase [Mucilaginibacter sp. SMC90]|uniref:TlpA family protein disulfide reductase n=1 Tax=Mucilaginibacter sp. SMC90 TaxID=2929803 RepID=UPI001FB441AA|nr:TlpA disulfide reductase family protein [Mucilaginibacter sp. SMC90]UOE50905.1 TlpA family protein disulfide reductase [Mucilaginibacter sp. SMC90]
MMKKIFCLMLCALTCVQLHAAERLVKIRGKAEFLNSGDSVSVTIYPYAERLNEIKTTFTVLARNQAFSLEIPDSDKPRFIEVRFYKAWQFNLNSLLVFPGDDLNFLILKGKTVFSGLSSARFEVQLHMQNLSTAYLQQFPVVYSPDALPASFNRIDSCAAICLDYLESRKEKVGNAAYALLKNNIEAKSTLSKLGYMTFARLNKSSDIQEHYISALKNYGRPFNNYPSLVPMDELGEPTTSFSAELIYQRYLVDSCILARKKFNLHDCYLYESRNFKGKIREQLVTELFIMNRNSRRISVTDIDDSLLYINDPEFRAVLGKIRAMNTIGAKAPDFVLMDENNKPVKLSDFRGKLVILDFWFTGCGACEGLAPRLYALEKKYENQPVVFISISLDRLREKWLATLKTNKYTSPLAVKLYTEGRGDQHQVIKEYDVHGCPTIIMIDKEGRLCPRPELDERALSGIIERYL